MSPILSARGGMSAGAYGWGSASSAGGASAFDSIATWSAGDNSSKEISFTSIPSTYKHLQIRGYFELTTEGQTPLLRFNGDSGSNYSWHTIRQYNNTLLDTYGIANTSYAQQTFQWGTYGTQGSGFPNNIIIDIFDYNDTNKFKICEATAFSAKFANSLQRVSYSSGMWRGGSAISSISFNALLYTSNTRVSLYGIKGS